MVALHPRARARALLLVLAIHKRRAAHLPDYLDAARVAMPDRVAEPRFNFVILRLLLEADDEPEPGFESALRVRYDKFVERFEWTVDGAPAWATEERILQALTFWQKRSPFWLHAKDAVRILRGLQAAVAPGGFVQ